MSEKLVQITKEYWPILVAALLFASAWGFSTNQIGTLQRASTRIEAKLDQQAAQMADFQASVAAVNATSISTAADVEDLRSRLSTLEQKDR